MQDGQEWAHLGLDVGQVAREALELVADLVGELTRVAEDEAADSLLLDVELVERGEHEDSAAYRRADGGWRGTVGGERLGSSGGRGVGGRNKVLSTVNFENTKRKRNERKPTKRRCDL